MSEKRRDNKNRILQTGESQRKDGRYAYKYVDALGKPKFVYSWKLVTTDKTPAGKRDDLSMREKEKELQKDLNEGINPIGKKITVCELYEKQIRNNGNVKTNTKRGRNHLLGILKQDKLGDCAIGNVKVSDAKEWILRMKEGGFAYRTIRNYKRSLRAAFYSAIRDDCIRKNPFDFDIRDVIQNDTVPKVPLSPEQQRSFLDFIQNDEVYRKYYDEIIILLGTGLRVSELCGLTDAQVDFERKIIVVDHQLLTDGKIGYYIAPPKSRRGKREIPMNEKVYQAFLRVVKNRKDTKHYEIDGYKNFLFFKQDGYPKTARNYDTMFRCLVKKYKLFCDVELPQITTPHTMRHTFCTNMANAGMNPKALQYIMGHASITMTLNYYAHATFASAQTEMNRVVS